MSQPVIYWFRNNLRLSDNPSLHRAIQSGRAVIPIFIFDKRNEGRHQLGFEKIGSHRKQFLIKSVLSLKSQLADQGVHLHLRKGNIVEEVTRLASVYGADTIYACRETTTYEQSNEAALEEHFTLHLEFDQFLLEPSNTPFSTQTIPAVFGKFRRKVEEDFSVRVPLELLTMQSFKAKDIENDLEPTLPNPHIDERSAHPFKGGSKSAWQRIKFYLEESGKVSWYKKTRNGLIGPDYSTKFSAFLALGCISPVEIYHALKTYEKTHGANESTYWVVFELLWRDYFKWMSLKHGSEIFKLGGIQQKSLTLKQDRALFDSWRKGQTNDDFVNANMKELMTTGFMSNRGRQNVASYLVHDLGIDWRWGAAWMESLLVDYDCSSNWGNWMYVAGVGNDTRNKKFDTKWQADRYDPNGRYRKLWNSLF